MIHQPEFGLLRGRTEQESLHFDTGLSETVQQQQDVSDIAEASFRDEG